MNACDVRSVDAALAYLVDCQLATVSSLAGKKSRAKSDYQRHIAIAQRGIDWMREMGVSSAGTRADEIKDGNVAAWAKTYED